ncbi:MAG: hypothetical protein ACJAYC_000260 [Halieaceae bacterium]|jgi:hypothetical protein
MIYRELTRVIDSEVTYQHITVDVASPLDNQWSDLLGEDNHQCPKWKNSALWLQSARRQHPLPRQRSASD